MVIELSYPFHLLLRNFSTKTLEVLSLEVLFCAVQQNPEVFAIDSEFAADFFAIAFIEEDGFQQGPISNGQAEQDLLDFHLDLTGNCNAMSVGVFGCKFLSAFFVQRLAA
jgi:hypothetical protein